MHMTLAQIKVSPVQFSRLEINRKRWLTELADFLAFPSISAIPAHRRDIHAAAEWLAMHLSTMGLRNAQVLPGINGGCPSVYADWYSYPHKPTLLIYGHYDVQPVDPVSAWDSPPFKATLAGENLFARGASDDKGQLFIHLKAIECYLKTLGHLPINIKVWLEGEEEVNSPTLPDFLRREFERLKADAILISDTEMISKNCPSIIYGLRGSLTAELEVMGPKHDLHSGRYGGIVHNPLQALCEILSGFHDRNGRIAIQGFYDRVSTTLNQTTTTQGCQCCSLKEQKILDDLDIITPWGEPGFSVRERMTQRPALIINSLQGGYNGPGAKAIIPNRGSAKFSFRLVPNQSPEEVADLLRHHLSRCIPPTVKTRLKIGGASKPVLLSVKHPIMSAVSKAFQITWGKSPVFTRSGGTIPVVEQFQKNFQVPIVLMGFGLPDDDIHAPNEKMNLSQFFRGIETVVYFLKEYAQI
jgi:acetylornithine deacetylase/succinyl-diaminopimelate desuccinylase-like protein